MDDWKNLITYGAADSGSPDQYIELSQPLLFLNYRTWCLKKIFGAFDFSGIPDTWDYDYFLVNLFTVGYLAITDTSIGVIPLRCGVTGVNVFDRPTTAIFANPILGNFERDLYSEDPASACALVRLQYDYKGAMPIVDKYSRLLSLVDNAIAINLRNSKVSFIAFVDSKQQAASMESLYRQIDSGRPAVYMKKSAGLESGEDIYYNHVRDTFIADDLQLLKDSIVDDFLTEIGLNNTNRTKRERLIVDEVNANNDEIRSNVQHWLDTIRNGLDRANRLFNLQLSVKLRKFNEGKADDTSKAEDA